MSSCPTCGDNFDTDRAMKIHHSTVHGESIALETSECRECDNTFSYYPSEKVGVYCSSCVESGVNRSIDNIPNHKKNHGRTGEDNPNYRGGTNVSCCNCGGSVWVAPSDLKVKDSHFCNRGCYKEWWSENSVGENNPNWRGGYDENYGKGWWRARRLTLERDNEECQLCSADESENGRTCDVHHIKPVRSFEDKEKAHTLNNLITLCRSCHISVENGNRKV